MMCFSGACVSVGCFFVGCVSREGCKGQRARRVGVIFFGMMFLYDVFFGGMCFCMMCFSRRTPRAKGAKGWSDLFWDDVFV